MLGPSAGALRCFGCGEDRRCATDLVFIMVSGDLITAEDRGAACSAWRFYRAMSCEIVHRVIVVYEKTCFRT